jgi:2-amino-4-hydroxy-6-hydroxymethyldihydropteridine diphosphokinase
MRNIAYLSLGSNVGDREGNLRDAVRRLSELGTVDGESSLYETEPVEVVDQPWFLNCVVRLQTERTAEELLTGVLGIERAMGRERTRPKGPRNIDIDILLFGDQQIDSPGLKIPHPGLAERLFVLEPMAEIAPEVAHPELKITMRELRNRLVSIAPVVRRKSGK